MTMKTVAAAKFIYPRFRKGFYSAEYYEIAKAYGFTDLEIIEVMRNCLNKLESELE